MLLAAACCYCFHSTSMVAVDYRPVSICGMVQWMSQNLDNKSVEAVGETFGIKAKSYLIKTAVL